MYYKYVVSKNDNRVHRWLKHHDNSIIVRGRLHTGATQEKRKEENPTV